MKRIVFAIALIVGIAAVTVASTPRRAECVGNDCKSYNSSCHRHGPNSGCGRGTLHEPCELSCVSIEAGFRTVYRCR